MITTKVSLKEKKEFFNKFRETFPNAKIEDRYDGQWMKGTNKNR